MAFTCVTLHTNINLIYNRYGRIRLDFIKTCHKKIIKKPWTERSCTMGTYASPFEARTDWSSLNMLHSRTSLLQELFYKDIYIYITPSPRKKQIHNGLGCVHFILDSLEFLFVWECNTKFDYKNKRKCVAIFMLFQFLYIVRAEVISNVVTKEKRGKGL